MGMTNVWESLTHENIFSSVEKALGEKLTGLLIQRNSYINRVYELETDSDRDRIIVKFYRPGRWTKDMILEEHAFLMELEGRDVPVITPTKLNGSTLFNCDQIFFCIFPKKGGRAIDEFDKDSWEMIGRHLARVHSVGEEHKVSKRIVWRPGIATRHHVEVLKNNDLVPADFQKSLYSAADLFIKKFDGAFDSHERILIHGDCHKGNLIHRPGEGIWLIDFDDICVGPPVQDLWMLLPGPTDTSKNEIDWFLKGYETFRQFDMRSLELIPALRGMRLIHFASWLAVQSHDPYFEKHFSESRTPKYWNGLIKELQGIVFAGSEEIS
jgi:Ser/Thr protein kinase RdoA (MazF antagonist)